MKQDGSGGWSEEKTRELAERGGIASRQNVAKQNDQRGEATGGEEDRILRGGREERESNSEDVPGVRPSGDQGCTATLVESGGDEGAPVEVSVEGQRRGNVELGPGTQRGE